MSLILTRSPFNVSRYSDNTGTLYDAGAVLTVNIGNYESNVFEILKTYTLNFREKYFIDIAPLVRDYIEATYEINPSGQWIIDSKKQDIVYVTVIISGTDNGTPAGTSTADYFAVDGYLYSDEVFGFDYSMTLKDNAYYTGSSDTIYKLDNSNVRITLMKTQDNLITNPPISNETTTIKFYNKGVLQASEVFTNNYEESDSYYGRRDNGSLSNGLADFITAYETRVYDDSGILEKSKCLTDFYNSLDFSTDVDEIVIKNNTTTKRIKVNTISECKYDPFRLTFKNKLGAEEDLWFFKKSMRTLSTTKEEFKSNEFQAYNAGQVTRTKQQYNKNGTETMSLNSGFVVEELNESFKQLMLSEDVSMYDFTNNKTSAINITNGEFEYKTVTNDKLINYTIDIEFSDTVINKFV